MVASRVVSMVMVVILVVSEVEDPVVRAGASAVVVPKFGCGINNPESRSRTVYHYLFNVLIL